MGMTYFAIRGVIFFAILLAIALVTRKQLMVVVGWILVSLIYGVARFGFGGGGLGTALAVMVDPFTIVGVIIALIAARPKKQVESAD